MPQKDRTNPNRKKAKRPDIKPRKRVTKKKKGKSGHGSSHMGKK